MDSLQFDAETRELIGLDDIKGILGEIDAAAEMDVAELEEQAQAVKNGEPGTEPAGEDADVVEDVDT